MGKPPPLHLDPSDPWDPWETSCGCHVVIPWESLRIDPEKSIGRWIDGLMDGIFRFYDMDVSFF